MTKEVCSVISHFLHGWLTNNWWCVLSKGFSPSNKITDAGVCDMYSGSTRILLPGDTRAGRPVSSGVKNNRENQYAGRRPKVSGSSPVNVIVFVKVQKTRSNLACHSLNDQRVRGHWVCCPTATEVSFNISLYKGNRILNKNTRMLILVIVSNCNSGTTVSVCNCANAQLFYMTSRGSIKLFN